MRRVFMWMLILVAAVGLFGCDTRDLPSEDGDVVKIITLYNGNLEETKKMNLLDTMYVKIAGMKPQTPYTVRALAPDKSLISEMVVYSDAQGNIGPSPLWYDVGLKGNSSNGTVEPEFASSLSLNSFYVNVTGDGSTDYTEPFFIIGTGVVNSGDQPQPVVWAADASGNLENAFEETGTKFDLGAGPVAGKTKVYLEARNLAASIDGVAVTSVDVYILPAKPVGELWVDGDNLTANFTIRKASVAVTANGNVREIQNLLIWNLDDPATPLINPTEGNTAYDIVIDVNKDGKFNKGIDVDGDGVTDRYVDGVDGQGVPGFIVANTEANDFYATIVDDLGPTGNTTNTMAENGLGGYTPLYLKLKNLPPGTVATDVNIALRNAADTIDHYTANPDAPSLPVGKILPETSFTILPNLVDITSASTVKYVLVVSLGGVEKYRSDINIIHPPANLLPTDGTATNTIFDETGTPGPGGKTAVHVSSTGGIATVDSKLYVYPRGMVSGGFDLASGRYTVKKNAIAASSNITNQPLWDLNDTPKLKNPKNDNNTYEIILDVAGDGTFNGPDLKTTFTVRDTRAANDVADVSYVNIASGGVFSGFDYTTSVNSNDYRDVFTRDGANTLGSNYVTKGIKAIWNPYIRDTWGSPATIQDAWYGRMVDVYIVNAATADLSKGADLGTGGNSDVAGGVKSIPVQYSCSNGAGQQNIWLPDFTVGRYYVIVDVNQDGKITNNVDIIDAVTQDGRTIKDDPSIVGFSVD